MWRSVITSGEAPAPRWGHTSTLVDTNTVLVFGGCGEENVFYNDIFYLTTTDDEGSMEWKAMQTTGTSPPSRCGHSATLISATELLVFGGFDGSTKFNDTFMLNLETLEWSKIIPTAGAPPPERFGHSAAAHGRNLYVFGGDGQSRYNDLYVFNVDALSWQQVYVCGTTPPGRCGHRSCVVGDRMVVVGGMGVDELNFSDCYELELDTMTWVQLQPTRSAGFHPRGYFSLLKSPDSNSVLVLGGFGDGNFHRDLHKLNLDTHQFVRLFPAGNFHPGTCDHSACVMGDRIYLFGGLGDAGLCGSVSELEFSVPMLSNHVDDLEPFVGALAHTASADTQLFAVHVLLDLLRHEAEWADWVATPEIADSLMRILETEEGKLREGALEAISVLAVLEENKHAFFERSLHTTLVSLLASENLSPELQRLSVWTLGLLADLYTDALLLTNALLVLEKLIIDNTVPVETCCAAIITIGVLAVHTTDTLAMLQGEMLKGLLLWLQSSHSELQRLAATAVGNLAAVAEARTLISKSGVVPPLLNMLVSSNAEDQRIAVGVLGSLVTCDQCSPEIRNEIVSATTTSRVLFLSTYGRPAVVGSAQRFVSDVRDIMTDLVWKLPALEVLSVSDVADFLEHCGLGEYRDIFAKFSVDGTVLLDMMRTNFKLLVPDNEHRRMLTEALDVFGDSDEDSTGGAGGDANGGGGDRLSAGDSPATAAAATAEGADPARPTSSLDSHGGVGEEATPKKTGLPPVNLFKTELHLARSHDDSAKSHPSASPDSHRRSVVRAHLTPEDHTLDREALLELVAELRHTVASLKSSSARRTSQAANPHPGLSSQSQAAGVGSTPSPTPLPTTPPLPPSAPTTATTTDATDATAAPLAPTTGATPKKSTVCVVC